MWKYFDPSRYLVLKILMYVTSTLSQISENKRCLDARIGYEIQYMELFSRVCAGGQSQFRLALCQRVRLLCNLHIGNMPNAWGT